MDENILSWNMENWITVIFMVLIPWLVIGFVFAMLFGRIAKKNGAPDGQ